MRAKYFCDITEHSVEVMQMEFLVEQGHDSLKKSNQSDFEVLAGKKVDAWHQIVKISSYLWEFIQIVIGDIP